MKIGGIDPKTLPAETVLVLPRGEEVIVFKARGLQDMDEFNKLCPEPTPPRKMTKDGLVADVTNSNYKTDMDHYGKRRLAYMVVKSLEPSEIEWDTVDVHVPGTWTNWEQDLKNAGLTTVEANRVIGLVLEANSLDESKLKQARDVFLRGPLVESEKSFGPTTEPANTPSGEPV